MAFIFTTPTMLRIVLQVDAFHAAHDLLHVAFATKADGFIDKRVVIISEQIDISTFIRNDGATAPLERRLHLTDAFLRASVF